MYKMRLDFELGCFRQHLLHLHLIEVLIQHKLYYQLHKVFSNLESEQSLGKLSKLYYSGIVNLYQIPSKMFLFHLKSIWFLFEGPLLYSLINWAIKKVNYRVHESLSGKHSSPFLRVNKRMSIVTLEYM